MVRYQHRKIISGSLLVLALLTVVSVRMHAQVSGATLAGTVSDTSGASIPGVQVSIKNAAIGQERVVTTDSAGFYSSPNLLPGEYVVTAAVTGFSSEVRSGITLTVGAQQVLNITMKVGQLSDKVEVSGEAPVPPSCPLMSTRSACALATPAATVPTPTSATSFTEIRALGLTFFKS